MIRLNRSGKVFTCSVEQNIDDLQVSETLKKRLRVGDLVQWGGAIRERIDMRRYPKPFAFYVEQPQLFITPREESEKSEQGS